MAENLKDLQQQSIFRDANNSNLATRRVSDTNSDFLVNRYLPGFSSETLLLNGQSFTSAVVDMSSYQFLRTEIYSDQNGTLQGFWYSDAAGTKLERTFTLPYVASEQSSVTGTNVLGKYLKYVFTNDSGSNQTQFRIDVKVSNVPHAGQLIRTDQFVPSNILTQVTRSILTGTDVNGTYRNVKVNEFGVISSSDFLFEVSRGFYPEVEFGNKFGRNPEINFTSTGEDIWDGGDTYTGMPLASVTPETITVTSDNANDTAAGTGARTVRLTGLDANWERQIETVTLNGLGGVTTVNTWRRMSRMEVITAGSSGWNEGVLTANYTTTNSIVFATIPINANQTSIGCDTVPAGKQRTIFDIHFSIARASGAAGSANIWFLYRPPGEVFRTLLNEEISTSQGYEDGHVKFVFSAMTDIKWHVRSVSDNNTVATTSFKFLDYDI